MSSNIDDKLNKDCESNSPSVQVAFKRPRSNSSPEESLKRVQVTQSYSEINKMMDEKLRDFLSELLDKKFADVPTKNDLKIIENKIDKIIDENIKLKEEVVLLKEQNKVMQRNMEFLLRKGKAKNLIFGGFQDIKKEEDLIKIIKEFCIQSLGIKEPLVDRAFTFGKNNNLILVEFLKLSDVHLILKNARKLKNTGLWIQKDMTYQDRKRRKKFLELKNQILEKNKEARVLIRDDYLLFRNKKFFWSDEQGVTTKHEEDLKLFEGYVNNEDLLVQNIPKN